jgi:hypothetical protein
MTGTAPARYEPDHSPAWTPPTLVVFPQAEKNESSGR